MVQIWFSPVLYGHVRKHALCNVGSIFGKRKPEWIIEAVMDFRSAMEMGKQGRKQRSAVDNTICLRLLQSDADITDIGTAEYARI